MSASNSTENFQQAVLERLDNLATDVDKLTTDVDKLTTDVDKLTTDVNGLRQELALTNVRVDTYQKASTQVVNLAFGLIATATVTIIATTIFK
jgi:outer membrane murein-binding lipoprotein Lpp